MTLIGKSENNKAVFRRMNVIRRRVSALLFLYNIAIFTAWNYNLFRVKSTKYGASG